MSPQRYALIVAVVFAALAALQLARAVLGWPVAEYATSEWVDWRNTRAHGVSESAEHP